MRRMRVQDAQILIGALLLVGGGVFAVRGWREYRDSVSPTTVGAGRPDSATASAKSAPARTLGKGSVHDEPAAEVAGTSQKRLPRFAGATPRLRYGIDAQGACTGIEFPGQGSASSGWSDAEWTQVARLFETVRSELADWIKKDSHLSDRTREVMKAQLGLARLERPLKDEPDLGWRGIAVWSLDDASAPTIRVGAGFRALMTSQPARARFELTRTVAQSWAPCELLRLNAPLPFTEELTCLGVQAQESCTNGTYSEAGWALSTYIARQVAEPGCDLPALQGAEIHVCLRTVGRSVASTVTKGAQ